MFQLEDEHQTYLIERLACFAKPSLVILELKDLFGVDATLARLNYYDPTKTQGKRELAAKWKDLFFATRKAFLDDPDAVPARQQQYRLLRLQEIVETAKGAATQMKALEQIAKEVGGAYNQGASPDVDKRITEILDFLVGKRQAETAGGTGKGD